MCAGYRLAVIPDSRRAGEIGDLLRLPTSTVDGLTLYKRITLIAEESRISHVCPLVPRCHPGHGEPLQGRSNLESAHSPKLRSTAHRCPLGLRSLG